MTTAAPSLESLYRTEVRATHAFLWRLGAREHEMDDLVHDVFLIAARRLETYDPSRPVRPWLFGIVTRVFLASRRKNRAQEQVSPDLEDAQPGPEDQVRKRQAQRLLQQVLSTLPEDRRAAFVLHELEGLSVNEISELMEVPTPTTYSRLRVAREEVAAGLRRAQLLEGQRGGEG